MLVLPVTRSFINDLSGRTTGFHRRARLFEPNFFIRKTFRWMVKPEGKMIFTAVDMPALNESLAVT